MPERILVIDDDQLTRDTVSRALGRVGYEVVGVDSAEAGLEAMEKGAFACALVDLHLPGAGGHFFVRQCRARLPELPVVVISGTAEVDDAIECLRAGVADFLKKPFTQGELRGAVLRCLESRTTTVPVVSFEELESPARRPARRAPPADGSRVRKEQARPPEPRLTLQAALERLKDGRIPLPPLPRAVAELRRLFCEGSSSTADLLSILERTPHLAAGLTRVANGPLFDGLPRAGRLPEVVARLGLRETLTLAGALALSRFFTLPPGDSSPVRPILDELWQHSFVRAVVMRIAARTVPHCGTGPDRAFASGLLCDCAVPFLLRLAHDHCQGDGRLGEALQSAGLHHPQLGAAIVRSWDLPEDCALACRGHHGLARRSDVAPPILQLLQSCEPIVSSLHRARRHPAVPFFSEVAESVGLDPGTRELVAREASSLLDGYRLLFSPEARWGD